MAPISRPSQGVGGVGKKVHRKKSANQREPSQTWALFHHQGMDSNAGDVPMDEPEDDLSPVEDEVPDLNDVMVPLRETADRVGSKVEEFATHLDQFLGDLALVSSRFDAVHDLVLTFKAEADKAVEELKKSHERELRDHLKDEWRQQANISVASNALRSSSMGTRKEEQIKELREWQQEADIWDLFNLMLELHPFESDEPAIRAERDDELRKMGPVHRYTTEQDLWNRFVLEDDVARERHLVKQWLERTADHQQSNVKDLVDVLEAKSGKGKGLWNVGWMDTRERIKARKLRETWSTDENAPLPQVQRSDNNELLITKLDPDAPSRQGTRTRNRTLETADTYFERAMWIACWEMLRRGKDWDEVCEWCEERREGWRAACLGRAMDESDPAFSGAVWRRVCLQASSNTAPTNEYESAVFGLLGGNEKAMERVCKSVDDHLFAFYTATLLRRFDQYVINACPQKAAPEAWHAQNEPFQTVQQAQQAIGELIQKLRKRPETSNESAEPMKIIQSYLLADEVGSLIHTVGTAVVDAANLHGAENVLFLRDQDVDVDGVALPEIQVALNPQTLRIAAHMAILYGVLNPAQLEGDELREDENVLVTYIQALRIAGKLDIIPIYGSRLQRERYVAVLSRVLVDIQNPRDRQRFLGLLLGYSLDVIAILTEQLNYAMSSSLIPDRRKPPPRILEPADDTKLHPGRRIIVGFLPGNMGRKDHPIVAALSWFMQMEGGWKVTFAAFSLALRKCLVMGQFGCALQIVRQFPYDTISMAKSYSAVGKSVNIMTEEDRGPTNEKEAMAWQILQRQSRTYYDLSKLVQAMEALSEWREIEHTYVSNFPKPVTVPSSMKTAKANLTDAMVPILNGILLNAADEDEKYDFDFIRINYLPETIMGYLTVLHAAGNLISRENLLDAMDLANLIARGKNEEGGENGLEEAFVEGGRVRELLECFALTSKVMLVLKAEGKHWKPKKRSPRELGMWELVREFDD